MKNSTSWLWKTAIRSVRCSVTFSGRRGHTVSEAENGDQAIRRVREGHYDLILLDYKMPKMNGMQVLQAVKGINPEIDVVIITAYGTI